MRRWFWVLVIILVVIGGVWVVENTEMGRRAAQEVERQMDEMERAAPLVGASIPRVGPV